MRAVDLTAATRDLLAPVCRECTWWLRPAAGAGPALARREWEEACEAEAGFFGRALLDGEAVVGWLHLAPSRLVPRAASLPAGPPSPDAWLLTCAYFYDEEYLHGFQRLLQEAEASLKHRQVAALEAFALCETAPEDAFRGYLRTVNLFHHEVLEGHGFRRVAACRGVARYRLDLRALVEAPRRTAVWAADTPAAAQPV